MLIRTSLILLLSTFIVLPLSAQAASPLPTSVAQNQSEYTIRSLPVSGGAAVQVMVPLSWNEQVQSQSDRPSNFIFRPKSGQAFEFMLTPIKVEKAESLAPNVIREGVDKSAKEIKSKAVENTLYVQNLDGETSYGSYFNATDKRPVKEGEYKFMTQGIMAVGSAMVPFTIIHNDETGGVAERCLNILRGAAYSAD